VARHRDTVALTRSSQPDPRHVQTPVVRGRATLMLTQSCGRTS
jgi:hypothetical protein